MNCFKGAILKVVLPLVLALSAFSAATAEADAPAVQLQTYGTLPVMVVNLTQSPINFNVSTSQGGTYATGNLPIAVGLSGWYYPTNNGATALFSNATTPTITPNGVANPSLQPGALSTSSASTNYGFMNSFTLFPSWTTPVQYKNTGYNVYSFPNGSTSLGATPGPSNTGIYYPGSLTAYAQSMAGKSTCSINLSLLSASGGANPPGYIVTINSEGGQTSSYQPPSKYGKPDWFEDILTVLVDIETLADPSVIGVTDMLYGIYSTIKDVISESESPNTTNEAYPAKYAGINVTAALAATSTGASLSLAGNADNYLAYETTAANATATLPLDQQNDLLVFTWRASPANTSTDERNAADTLFVIVINEAVYAASQTQQYLNNTAPAQVTTAGLQYKPTKEQAGESHKILGILTAIAKKSPQDAQRIVDMFGLRGQYKKIQHDPNAAAEVKTMLKEVFEKHANEIPTIQPYLAKLAQK